MNHSARPFNRLLISIITPALLIVLAAGPAAAQRSRSRSMAAERAAAKAADFEAYQREMRLRNLGEQNKQATEKQQRLALEQIKEDFERMQAVNNDMMRAVVKSSSLDHKLVSQSLEEINKRARRLKENLKMQDYEVIGAGEDKAATVADLKASLVTLDDFIMSFVKSPLFQNPQVIDTIQRAKAGSDLANIIGMSRDAKKMLVRVEQAH
jgi:hypothetical protein